MTRVIMPILLFLILISCEEESKRKIVAAQEIGPDVKELAIDSLYLSTAIKHNSEINWEQFQYQHLYQLQDYLESKSGKFTIKHFSDYEIYRKDTSYFCTFKIDEFSNDIYLELELPKFLLNELSEITNNSKYNFHVLSIISIDEFVPIDFRFKSEMDYYHSEIVIERYKALRGKGKLVEIEYYREEKPDNKRYTPAGS